MFTSTDPDCQDVNRPGMCAMKHELPEVRRKLRAKHPLPNERQLRRSQQPLYMSLHMELVEDGFEETAAFLYQLMKLEGQLHAHITEGLNLKCLYEVPRQLEELLDSVKATERVEPSKSQCIKLRTCLYPL